MSETPLFPSDAGQMDDYAPGITLNAHYGCVFCRTGQERFVAHALSEKYEDLRAMAVTQVKHKSVKGIKSTEEHILLPGYVFFQAYDEDLPLYDLQYVQGVIRLLRGVSGRWRLQDEDHLFAQWVFQNGGRIELSKAYSVGDKVRILSGPLKDYEGNIIKIDRRSRNGQVEIRFDNKVWKIWLAFEMVDMQAVQEDGGRNAVEA